MFEELANAFFFILPLYLINMLLLFLGARHIIDTPLISERWFGKHRSWKGAFLILILSTILFYFSIGSAKIGFVLGLGMMLGNLSSSLVKRVFNFNDGASFPILDQLDFVLGSAITYFLFFGQVFNNFILICLMTLILHPLGNIIAYKLKLKKVWW